ncbi:MAG: phosphoribosylaminoimidazolesuccinocarboxamide synthase [Tissierellia bacterium]|nr:phosphoribosylaminoimidazolesuccinocarboxamide synthase [Tissierellia bacterium]
MKLIVKGKTKDLYELDNGLYELHFKDDMTGKDGVFDPGANEVGLVMEGAGLAGLRMTKYFYEKFNEMGINTHYVESDLSKNTMVVHPAEMFGKGVEVILRYRAVGSFIRRYGLYAEEGMALDSYVEFTLKDDKRGDPLITREGLDMLGIMTKEEYDELYELTIKLGALIKEDMEKKGLELYDMKFEYGRIGEDKRVALIDEISGGNMRVYKDGAHIKPLELEKIFLGDK